MNQRGSFTVEAALVIPVIVVVLVACIELVGAVFTHQRLVVAAREGVRVAATVSDPAAAVKAVRDSLGPDLGAKARVTVRRPAVVGKPAMVVVSLPHGFLTPFLRALHVELSSRATMRVEG